MSVNYGYYESWAATRACHRFTPQDIDVVGNGFTHLGLAFAGINADDELAPWADDYVNQVPLYQQFNALKDVYFQPVQTLIAVGGWTFTNPGTATRRRFSEISANATRTAVFAQSVVTFLQQVIIPQINVAKSMPLNI
jgi:chitinase